MDGVHHVVESIMEKPRNLCESPDAQLEDVNACYDETNDDNHNSSNDHHYNRNHGSCNNVKIAQNLCILHHIK